MNMRALVLFIFVILYSVHFANADAFDTGVNMISNGLENAAADAGNDLNNGSSNFSSLADPYNPLDNPSVISLITVFSGINFLLFLLFLVVGLVYVLLIRKNARAYKLINFVFNDGNEFDFMWYATALGRILILSFFVYVIMSALLIVAWLVTSMMGIGALNAVQGSDQSGWVTFVYDILMWIIGIFMIMRNILLSVFFGVAVPWVILREYPPVQELMNNIGMYFITIVFMQPILVLVATIGVATDEWINDSQSFQNPFLPGTIITPHGAAMSTATEVAIVFLLLYIAYKMFTGVKYITRRVF